MIITSSEIIAPVHHYSLPSSLIHFPQACQSQVPEKNGVMFSVLWAVNKEVPIIMLTAKPMTEDLVKAYDLGCNDFVRKPFVMEELIKQ